MLVRLILNVSKCKLNGNFTKFTSNMRILGFSFQNASRLQAFSMLEYTVILNSIRLPHLFSKIKNPTK